MGVFYNHIVYPSFRWCIFIRFNISQNRIKNLNIWKNKKGCFHSLSDVLEVEGLSVKTLEKMCLNIINNIDKVHETIETVNKTVKSKNKFVSPTIGADQMEVESFRII